MKSLRPFFSYYGGKWRNAKHYPAPKHETIVEPFAGSAGYALRYPDRQVKLYDLDPVICTVWDYLIKVRPDEVQALPDVPVDGTVDDLNVCAEAKLLIGFWLNRGSARPCKTPSKWFREGLAPSSFWGPRTRKVISEQVEFIRHWTVENKSYQDIGDLTATWFVDPPYEKAGGHYKFGSRQMDFPHLGAWCQSRQGQTIVCEADGATWLPFNSLGDFKATRKGTRSKESIWYQEN